MLDVLNTPHSAPLYDMSIVVEARKAEVATTDSNLTIFAL